MPKFFNILAMLCSLFALALIIAFSIVGRPSSRASEPMAYEGNWDLTNEPITGRHCVKVTVNGEETDYLCKEEI